MNLVTPDAMREMDRRTIEDIGIPSIVLMDRAACAVVDALIEHHDLRRHSPIGILCGTGNNGGDGLAIATLLAHRGLQPQLVVLGEQKDLSDDAVIYFDIASHTVKAIHIAPDQQTLQSCLNSLPDCQLWCDALLGTGLDREVTGCYATAIEFLRDQSTPLVAVDIPSGIDGRTGQVLGVAAPAEMTLTFGAAKIGQMLDPARTYCGQIIVVDIGIPHHIVNEVGVAATALDDTWLANHISPRPLDTHKGKAGKTLHIGGRLGTTGAIALSARAALVGGAGLITVVSDPKTCELIPISTPEIMARGLIDEDTQTIDEDALHDQIERADTIVIGPGLGTDDLALRLMHLVLNARPTHLIIDADGLNLLAAHDDLATLLREISAASDVILTPHPGELSRLQQVEVGEILGEPVESAKRLAHHFNGTAVLKTAATIIAHPDGRIAINRSGNPGMATGGMGDALTGLIASASADFPEDPFLAASCAVFVHGHAGDMASRISGQRGLTVGRLLDEVPSVWQSFHA